MVQLSVSWTCAVCTANTAILLDMVQLSVNWTCVVCTANTEILLDMVQLSVTWTCVGSAKCYLDVCGVHS